MAAEVAVEAIGVEVEAEVQSIWRLGYGVVHESEAGADADAGASAHAGASAAAGADTLVGVGVEVEVVFIRRIRYGACF